MQIPLTRFKILNHPNLQVSLILNLKNPANPVDPDLLIDPIRNHRIKNLRKETDGVELEEPLNPEKVEA